MSKEVKVEIQVKDIKCAINTCEAVTTASLK